MILNKTWEGANKIDTSIALNYIRKYPDRCQWIFEDPRIVIDYNQCDGVSKV